MTNPATLAEEIDQLAPEYDGTTCSSTRRNAFLLSGKQTAKLLISRPEIQQVRRALKAPNYQIHWLDAAHALAALDKLIDEVNKL